MPLRLPPTHKRMARTASTLAADLRRPVVILRDTVSLPLSAALFFFSLCPSTAERGYLQNTTVCISIIHTPFCRTTANLSHTRTQSLFSFHSSCCATSSDAIHSSPTHHNT